MLDLRSLPLQPALLSIVESRRAAFINELHTILSQHRLSPGLAGKICGKLGFGATQLWGRLGRAKLRPFSRRQHEQRHFNLNVQLIAAIVWWIRQLSRPTLRAIPLRVADLPPVVSYSDGEGEYAGVGVGVWFPDCTIPEAGYLQVPPEIRTLWSRQRGRGMLYNDIFEIEAIGPALILFQWGRRMKNCMWLHFIDIEGAQAALVKGSSSVHEGDIITGFTWEEIARREVFAWFDRVASASNPVDKLSRGELAGPWRNVRQLKFPPKLLNQLQRQL